jgi:hypothetical protein
LGGVKQMDVRSNLANDVLPYNSLCIVDTVTVWSADTP